MTPPRRLRVGIAGYGVVGKRRRHFIDKHPQLELVAVCDRMFVGIPVNEDAESFFLFDRMRQAVTRTRE